MIIATKKSAKQSIDFKKPDKTKIILWIIAGFFCVVGLANWIATSFGTMDNDMSRIFFQGMDNKFFRGWAAYTVLDGYITVISYVIPLIFLVFESLWKWFKVNHPKLWVSRYYKQITNGVTGFLCAFYAIFICLWLAMYCLFDQGFGPGFAVEFLAGKEYIIPIYIVSVLINSAIFGVQMYYYHNVLPKKPDFLEKKIWRKVLPALIFLIYCYIPIMVMKAAFGRPYWYNIHFNDGATLDGSVINNTGIQGPLAKIEQWYGYDSSYVQHYLNSSTTNYGWNLPLSDFNDHQHWITQSWPTDMVNFKWWQVGKGKFTPNTYPYSVICSEQAFPSGHLAATTFVWLLPTIWFDNKSKSKKQNTLKWLAYGLGSIYVLDMTFALQVSTSHYWSDMMFTLFWAPVAYICSWFTVNAILNAINKRWNLNW